ncbi:hypothetical protein F7734_15135 [Scytonema sp. UIC 10036]|uniref:hypothetical protein n=1 Tax=Scytonema sp. UIC 10036 TaxID=2304196 RepID=UPI0012DAE361|nr:hypothetical protein [Scytonema sp. UIC 10036]MUG93681.1 hypothetical protein [Scytonema sp. UIC 10036]
MKTTLAIRELSYLSEVSGITVMGGRDVVAITETIAIAKPGSASAAAFASAQGEYIGIQTEIEVVNGANFNLANATAEAYAKSENKIAQSLSYSNASSVTNRYSSTSQANSVSFNWTT